MSFWTELRDAVKVVGAVVIGIYTGQWQISAAIISSEYGRRKQKKAAAAARDAYNAALKDRLVMVNTVDTPRSRVYGRVRTVDGVLFKATHGANKEFYTLVIALAGHEVDAIETVYFDDKPVELAGNGLVTTAPYAKTRRETHRAAMPLSGGAGSVDIGAHVVGSVSVQQWVVTEGAGWQQVPFAQEGNVVSVSGLVSNEAVQVVFQRETVTSQATVVKYTGASSQDVGAQLRAWGVPLIGEADRFRGIACLAVQLVYDQDVYPTSYPSISAVVRGARVLHSDGSVQWSENPGLIALDWARYAHGIAAAEDELDVASFHAAADECDTPTDFVTDGVTTTRPRYTCSLVCGTDADPLETFSEITESMAGQWAFSGGRLRVRAGVWRDPVPLEITEDWISDAGTVEVVSGAGRQDVFNVVRPSIADSAQDYVVTPTAEVRAAAYITADGEELPQEMTFGGITDAEHAQHVAGVMLREARQALTLKLPCNLRAWPLEIFDVVPVTLPRYGWAGKLFEVRGWEFSQMGGVVLNLSETAPEIFDVDAGFASYDSAPNTTLPTPWVVSRITGLTVGSGVASDADGSIITRTRLAWDAVTDERVRQSGKIEVQYLELPPPDQPAPDLESDGWPSWVEDGASTGATIPALKAGGLYMFRVRGVSTLGVRGAWGAQVMHKAAPAPQLGTGGIVEHAVTEVLQQYVAGPIAIDSVVEVARIVVPAYPVDCTLEVTATFSVTITPGTGGAVQRAWAFAFFDSFVGGTGAQYRSPVITDLTETTMSVTLTGAHHSFAGSESWVRLLASKGGSAAAGTLESCVFKVTVIKR